jgi:pimeloyl-ACP methyl ester carboxylesterase
MKSRITRREWGALAAAAIAGPMQLRAQTKDPVLDIADWSYKFYGVEHATLARGTVCNGMQMYVERWIPAQVRHPYPVVLIHGGYGQGSDWFSTPDGRRGWASMLLEQGYRVHVVDRPGQGRNPYQPFVHGLFDAQAQTLDSAARAARGSAIHTQWPGPGDADDPAVAQLLASMGQPMANSAQTQNVWRTRGAKLLDEIGPAVLITHGDGAVFAWVLAQDRPELVKGIVALEQSAVSLRGQTKLAKMAGVPIAIVTAEASPSNASDPGIAASLRQAGCPVEHIVLADRGVRGNGPMPMWEKNNREALAPVLAFLDTAVAKGAQASTPGIDPDRNRESTALKLAEQGSFWVGIGRKQMPYGSIAQGQMFVQYMIPAERKHPYPVILTHGGGGQGTHMMGIGGRPGWVHYFVQAGYAVYWLDRPSYGRSPYHPDALGPSHLPNVPPFEGLLGSTAVFNTAQWPGPGGIDDPVIDQFMACEAGNISDEALHSDLAWRGGVELVDRIGPCILVNHAFGGFMGWGVADRRPNLIRGIFCMEINGNPFAAQLRWGLTAAPMTYDPPVSNVSEFKLVDRTEPPDSPRPVPATYKLQAEPARQWKNLKGIPIGWMTSEFGGGGSPVANVEFLKQVGCSAEMVRLRDFGILGNGNLMLLEKNNHEVFGVLRDWIEKRVPNA